MDVDLTIYGRILELTMLFEDILESNVAINRNFIRQITQTAKLLH